VDLHSHLDLYPDAMGMLAEVSRRNAFTLVVTTSPRAWIGTTRMFRDYPNIHVALGLHPEIVERKADELPLLLSLVEKAPYIGEIGIDSSSRFRGSLVLQQSIFSSVVAQCQVSGGKIMSIHSRGAADLVLDVLERYPHAGPPILHWFSGTAKQLQRAIDLGCWFSVGPTMLKGLKGQNLFHLMPITRVLPETDGPFAQVNGASLLPWDAVSIDTVVAAYWGISRAQVRMQWQANLQQLLNRESL
jgi:TatD DNase family protein